MSKFFNRNWKAGFTLVELIVVIAILAILAGVAIPVYSGYIKKANRAADEQLLGAVNTAFAAACLENGFNAKDVTAASLTVSEKKITGVSGVSVPDDKVLLTAKNEGYGPVLLGAHPTQLAFSQTNFDASFAKYFGDNKNTELKYYESASDFTFANGVFSGKDTAGASGTMTMDEAIAAYQASNYYGNEEALLTSMNSITSVFSEWLGGKGLDNLNVFMSEEAIAAFAEEYGLAAEDVNETQIANALVLEVAKRTANNSAEDLMTLLNSEETNPDDMIVLLPMSYAVVTGYVNSEYASDEMKAYFAQARLTAGEHDDPDNTDSLDTLLSHFYSEDSESLKGYFDNDVIQDLNGYLGAMNAINNYKDSVDLTRTDAFNNQDILDLIQSFLNP